MGRLYMAGEAAEMGAFRYASRWGRIFRITAVNAESYNSGGENDGAESRLRIYTKRGRTPLLHTSRGQSPRLASHFDEEKSKDLSPLSGKLTEIYECERNCIQA